MGAVLGTAGCIACCCTSAACSLCSCCPSCKNSTSARIGYALVLLFSTIVSCIMLSPKVETQLQKIDWFCEKVGSGKCSAAVGYLAVYRIEFATAMFFLLFALLMIGVRTSRDGRASIQNGFWAIKILILIGGMVGAFFIPNDDGKFSEVWMYFGLIGSFIFILHQLILLVDFAHAWSSNWVDNMEESGSKCWMVALLFFTFAMYGGAIAAIVCMYIYFTQSSEDSCHLEKFVVSFELLLCIFMSAVAILPAVQERQPKSGLLQAAAISLYTSYLTWSALSYREGSCNDFSKRLEGTVEPEVDAQSVIGVVVTFILVIFACVRTSSSSQIGKIGLGENEGSGDGMGPIDSESGERKGQHVYDDEGDSVTYSYSFFHMIMMLGTLYIMMTLTNWYSPDGSNLNKLKSSTAAFWVKISSSWVCCALYLWTLIAPVLFPDRDFGN